MKPANFPERKRARQIGALLRLAKISAKGVDNSPEHAVLSALAARDFRGVRTKKQLATASAARRERVNGRIKRS